jgi:hypothetical protein
MLTEIKQLMINKEKVKFSGNFSGYRISFKNCYEYFFQFSEASLSNKINFEFFK